MWRTLKINEKTWKQATKLIQNATKNQPNIVQKSIKKTLGNQAKIIAEASRNEFGYMVGSGTLSGSPLVKFSADFGRHLGPNRTQDGSQNDAKII